MTFDRYEFEEVLKDVETLLGYLRGNENAWRYLREAQRHMEESHRSGVLFPFRLDEGYAFPCPNGRYKVEPSRMVIFNIYLEADQRFDRDPYVKALQQSIDMAWEDGVAWARGVADYCRSICDQFLRPSVSSLVDAVIGIQKEVVSPLLDSPNDDWAELGNFRTQWMGLAADEFNIFYDNYNDTLRRSGLFANLVNVGFASAAKVISGTQFGAQKFVESIRTALEDQLDQWAHWDRQPEDPSPPPPWVADVIKIGTSTLEVAADLVPVVKNVKDKIDEIDTKTGNATQLVKDIEEATGANLLPEKKKHIPVKSAEEIYKGLTETLYDDYYKAYGDALDQIQNGGPPGGVPDPSTITDAAFSGAGVLAQMKSDQEQGDWSLPHVPDESLAGDADYYPS
jgi:hypothetical protein